MCLYVVHCVVSLYKASSCSPLLCNFPFLPPPLSSHPPSNIPALSHFFPSTTGKMLSVVIVVTTEPVQYAAYTHAIKVTVDGPREPRRESSLSLSLSLSPSLPPSLPLPPSLHRQKKHLLVSNIHVIPLLI